jgi:aryl-alcohol dehydrogenase-like predicted oxidoreductase
LSLANSTEKALDTATLGHGGPQVSALGIGAWAWGDHLLWGYQGQADDSKLQATFDTALAEGINFFDTAEVYGSGLSERLVGRFMRASKQIAAPVIIATKFAPLPWRFRKGQLLAALRRSLDRLGLEKVDLYQIHFPSPFVPVETWADALADAVQAGLARAVGVSNYSARQMRRAHAILAKRGVPLTSNQVEYSLLVRDPERNGVLQTCRDLGMALIAYSPLGMGMLTGKYTPENLPRGARRFKYRRGRLARLQPLIGKLREIGETQGGKTPAQVALNWIMCKGAIPIPGAKSPEQARQNAGALGWRLTPDQVAALDAASEGL